MSFLEIKEHSGEGLDWGVISGNWKVGIKNYKPGNAFENLKDVERHLKTDEVFVLLEGECILIYGDDREFIEQTYKTVQMEKNKMYKMKKSVWHNMVTFPDTKMILIENEDTSMENSEVKDLKEEHLGELSLQIKKIIDKINR